MRSDGDRVTHSVSAEAVTQRDPWPEEGLTGRRAAVSLILGGLAGVACGGGGGGGGTPAGPTQPTGPTQAQVTVTYSSTRWALGGFPGFRYSFSFTITIRETAGLGIKGNFLRADFYNAPNGAGTLVERQEAGGNVLGRLAGNGSETEDLVIGFNAGSTSSVTMTFNGTDDRGNVLENRQTFNCC